jgi:hypothetical protein
MFVFLRTVVKDCPMFSMDAVTMPVKAAGAITPAILVGGAYLLVPSTPPMRPSPCLSKPLSVAFFLCFFSAFACQSVEMLLSGGAD